MIFDVEFCALHQASHIMKELAADKRKKRCYWCKRHEVLTLYSLNTSLPCFTDLAMIKKNSVPHITRTSGGLPSVQWRRHTPVRFPEGQHLEGDGLGAKGRAGEEEEAECMAEGAIGKEIDDVES